jgi:hypothetical protein
MSRLIKVTAWALAVCALLASNASAQFGRGGGFQMPVSVQNMFMLGIDAVQKELALNAEQIAEVNALNTQMRSDAMEIMSGLQDLTEEERKEEMPNVMKMVGEKGKELQGKVDKLLDAKQHARLKELSIQRRNLGALQDPEILVALKITDDQKKQLLEVRDGFAKEQEDLQKEFLARGGDRQALRPKVEALQKSMGEKVMAVLTTEQREQFDKMKGEKFTFPQQRGFGF